jgi:GDP-mannose 6-dehydrogenase
MVYDQNVRLAALMGANREYILNHIPHIGRLLVDRPEQLLEHAEVLVVGSASEEFRTLLQGLPSGRSIIDLVGVWSTADAKGAGPVENYDGIAW